MSAFYREDTDKDLHVNIKNVISLKECMKSVEFKVEELHQNPFEELGRAIIRAEQDIMFNKIMIDAWKKYIKEHDMKWNDR